MTQQRPSLGPASVQTGLLQPGTETRTLPTLRLRGAAQEPDRRIRWAEDVVDNEGMGRKKSKVCCIYHKPREVGESSSEESSSSSSEDSDSGADDGAARPVGGRRLKKRSHRHHEHDHDHEHSDGEEKSGPGNEGVARDQERRKPRKHSPNAYEKMPKGPAKHKQIKPHNS
ncbi:MAG: hypothetical protein M1814_001723 [Vezdaea aestivalis]|nr:MAG: hypothetical protein M1814_001723 [Vezdaea aestivalis]